MEPTSNGIDELKALRLKIDNPKCPTLDVGRAIIDYQKRHTILLKPLTIKLGVPNKRPQLSQIKNLTQRLTDENKCAAYEGQVLTDREIRKLLTTLGASKDQKDDDESPHDPSDVPTENVVRPAQAGDLPQELAKNPEERIGLTLLRDTINIFFRLLVFWRGEPIDGGTLAVRWIAFLRNYGWLKSSLRIAYFGLAVWGLMNLKPLHWKNIPWLNRHAGQVGLPAVSGLAAPQVTSPRWVSGHRLELHWLPIASVQKYRIYWNSKDGNVIQPIYPEVRTPGAIVAVRYGVYDDGFITVKGITAADEETPASARVAFQTEPINQNDTVEPLPFSGLTPDHETNAPEPNPSPKKSSTPQTRVPAPPAAPSVLTPPTNVHVKVRTPDLIEVSWRSMGKDIRYNMYSFSNPNLTTPRKENREPVIYNEADWVPETGLERYWIVITAIDNQNHESPYSEAVEVIRHPEKSGPGFADQAAGTLRKVLPW